MEDGFKQTYLDPGINYTEPAVDGVMVQIHKNCQNTK